MKEIFRDIVLNLRWDGVNTCGGGSSLDYTNKLQQQLPELLQRYNIMSMMDAPCGDFSWMHRVRFPAGFEYQGGDIVLELVERNRAAWPGYQFQEHDLTSDALPDVDMLFCRDCLFHFSQADIQRVIDRVQESQVRYVLTTTYLPGHCNNTNIETGGFRPICLTQAPFNMSRPIESIADGPDNQVIRHMALFTRKQFQMGL